MWESAVRKISLAPAKLPPGHIRAEHVRAASCAGAWRKRTILTNGAGGTVTSRIPRCRRCGYGSRCCPSTRRSRRSGYGCRLRPSTRRCRRCGYALPMPALPSRQALSMPEERSIFSCFHPAGACPPCSSRQSIAHFRKNQEAAAAPARACLFAVTGCNRTGSTRGTRRSRMRMPRGAASCNAPLNSGALQWQA